MVFAINLSTVNDAYKKYDRNNDGYLDSSEIQSALKNLKGVSENAQLKMDTNFSTIDIIETMMTGGVEREIGFDTASQPILNLSTALELEGLKSLAKSGSKTKTDSDTNPWLAKSHLN